MGNDVSAPEEAPSVVLHHMRKVERLVHYSHFVDVTIIAVEHWGKAWSCTQANWLVQLG